MQNKIDEAANMWEKTKDPKYKKLWYKLIKEYVNGTNYFQEEIPNGKLIRSYLP